MSTESIWNHVGSVDDFRAEDRDIDWDELIRRFNSLSKPFEPAKTMNATGSWDIPIVLFESADGFAYDDRPVRDDPLWLLEGHLRMRYLRALVNTGHPVAAEHEVLVLKRARTRHRKRKGR